MAVLVTCKTDEDWIKGEVILSGQHCLHYKSMGKFIIVQGQVTPKKIFRSGLKSNLSEIL